MSIKSKLGLIAASLGLMAIGSTGALNNPESNTENVSKTNQNSNNNTSSESNVLGIANTLASNVYHQRIDPFIPQYGNFNNGRTPKEYGMYLQSNRKQKWSKKRKL